MPRTSFSYTKTYKNSLFHTYLSLSKGRWTDVCFRVRHLSHLTFVDRKMGWKCSGHLKLFQIKESRNQVSVGNPTSKSKVLCTSMRLKTDQHNTPSLFLWEKKKSQMGFCADKAILWLIKYLPVAQPPDSLLKQR